MEWERSYKHAKRGGQTPHVALDCDALLSPERAPALVALGEALEALAALDALKSRVVELRFFGGLSVEETSEVLRLSPRTFAKSWLLRELTTRYENDSRTRKA